MESVLCFFREEDEINNWFKGLAGRITTTGTT
jgi:hypothetical protein